MPGDEEIQSSSFLKFCAGAKGTLRVAEIIFKSFQKNLL